MWLLSHNAFVSKRKSCDLKTRASTQRSRITKCLLPMRERDLHIQLYILPHEDLQVSSHKNMQSPYNLHMHSQQHMFMCISRHDQFHQHQLITLEHECLYAHIAIGHVYISHYSILHSNMGGQSMVFNSLGIRNMKL